MDYQIEKENEKKKVKALAMIGFFVIGMIGTLLHFTYELFGNNLFVASFSAINESVWEHLKIAVMPTFLWIIIEFITLKYRQDNLWSSLLIKIITIMLTITLGFYGYTAIFQTHIIWLDILLFFVAILLGQVFAYNEMKKEPVKKEYEEIAKYLVLVIFFMFVAFTFIPPNLGIFKDEVTSTYGVFQMEY